MMAGLAREERGGVVVPASAFTATHRDAIIALAAQHRLPAIYSFPFFTADGGLMSYGVDLADLHRRPADYVDRILKGTKPGDLPVQLPTKFDLVINPEDREGSTGLVGRGDLIGSGEARGEPAGLINQTSGHGTLFRASRRPDGNCIILLRSDAPNRDSLPRSGGHHDPT
jgi:hypothetical protein